MIDRQSIGVDTSQIEQEKKILKKKAIKYLYVEWGSMCPILKFYTKIDTVLSVCLNQQLQLDDLVVQCVSKVWFSGLYEHNFHDFTFYPFAYIIYTIDVRATKL